VRERGLAAQPLGIVPGRDQQRGGCLGAHAFDRHVVGDRQAGQEQALAVRGWPASAAASATARPMVTGRPGVQNPPRSRSTMASAGTRRGSMRSLRSNGSIGVRLAWDYTAASGAGVVDTGTSSWICQIDSVCAPGRNSATTSAAVRRITINLLRAFAAGPTGRVNRSRSNLEQFDTRPSGL
jgi:hypothetical protein